ncbi:hypothetical protein PENTCL1PPCAC_10103, partial [Pristionchus entomophagus]
FRYHQAQMAAAASLPDALKSLLERSDVHMSNRLQTLEKIARLIDGGAERLSVVSDFDHTLTRAIDDDGEPLAVTHNVFGDTFKLPDMKQKSTQKKYTAYSKESAGSERLAMLEAWWGKKHDDVVTGGLTREQFNDLAAKTDIRLRDSSSDLLQSLSDAAVPTLLFSAGLSDAISFVLTKQMDSVPEAVHIIGNAMEFDENNKLVSFKTPLLHPFNKSAAIIDKASPLLSSISPRPHLLVLGDSMGDLTMEKGLDKDRQNTLRIGFLNGKLDDLKQFLAGFDIVIASDQSIELPTRIVKEIVGAK